ncbi:MAG: Fervidolysin [Luteibacter sp.]|uniref:S8 family serine peptidase n=1 Tax=Luteibacter sp. TaxID=1886636 RepID=UPI0013817916|nr:S8 family serine peptidase [Luteibacter sp.]KAF1008651.1 MAG: Fervidolysin [Luteibacter sp.]
MSHVNSRLVLALWSALGVVTAANAQQDLSPTHVGPAVSTSERASGTNAKLDSKLLRLKQEVSPASSFSAPSPSSTAQSRSSASTPVATQDFVNVDVVSKGDPGALRKQLEALGFKTEAVFRNNIGGRLPVSKIDQAAALDGVLRISAPEVHTNAGDVRSQGDSSQHSKLLRDTYVPKVDGKGLTVGVISDSFNCSGQRNTANKNNVSWSHERSMEDDIKSDDLPASPQIVKEEGDCINSGTDEGRAMAQIIHDVAPGAKIAFYAPSTQTDFAQGIRTLALPVGQKDSFGRDGAGAQIIVDDLGFFDEPLFQEGIIGDAINETVTQDGAAYFSAAGNGAKGGRGAYDNSRPAFSPTAVARVRSGTQPLNVGERLLNFDVSGNSTTVNIPVNLQGVNPGGVNSFTVSAYWDQPATGPGSASSLNLCIGDQNGKTLNPTAPYCSGPSGVGQPAQARVGVSYTGNQNLGITLRLGLVQGTAPGRVHLIIQNGFATFSRFGTDSGTIYGHPLADHAAAVGAADYFSTPYCQPTLRTALLEDFSSYGGTPFLFNSDGTPLAAARTPAKPEFVAPDGTTTTFFGSDSRNRAGTRAAVADCSQIPGYLSYNFYGTSAAAPHAAAVAALLWQAAPTAKTDDLYGALKDSALDMDDPGVDYKSGHGFIQADQALATLQEALKRKGVSVRKAASR